MHLSLLILKIFFTEWYAKIIVFPFLKTNFSRISDSAGTAIFWVLVGLRWTFNWKSGPRPVPDPSTRHLRGLDSGLALPTVHCTKIFCW